MSTEEGTYAPKSPDLSSFFSSGGPAPAATSASFTSAPNPTSIAGPGPGSGSGSGTPAAAGSGYSPSSTYNSSHQPQPAHYDQPQPHQTYSSPGSYNNWHSYTAPSPNSARPQQQFFSSPQQPQNIYAGVPQPGYVISQQPQNHSGPQPYYTAYDDSQLHQYLPQQPRQSQLQQPPHLQTSEFQPVYEQQQEQQQQHHHHQHQQQPQPQPQATAPEPIAAMPPRKSAAAQAVQQPEIMASPVRTKFPTARIKRIMQADEEVGKVAQQTPIAVGKALELFMVQIVSKSADVAKDKNSKRITAQMLKQAVESNPQWDFLQEIVAKVSEKEEPRGKTKANENTDSDEELDAEPKKKARGGRKKKAAA